MPTCLGGFGAEQAKLDQKNWPEQIKQCLVSPGWASPIARLEE